MSESDPHLPTVVITAGGRLPEPFAERVGVRVKALAPLGGRPLIARLLDTLAAAGFADASTVVVGPVEELRAALPSRETLRFVAEGQTGPENIALALAALTPEEKARPVLLCASDLPFVTPNAIHRLRETAPGEAEIVYPVIRREAFEAAFPGSPNTYARLAGREYTGGSILLVRPNAIERNLPLIRRVFDARKSQFAMARLLGPVFLLRFLTGRLTVGQAERRASDITGCRCAALMDAPSELAADIDGLSDYEWAETFLRESGVTELPAGVTNLMAAAPIIPCET